MTDVLSSPAAHALARALGHFVWQGATIGLVMLVAFRLFRSSASARYAIGVAGLAAMLAAPVITFTLLVNQPQPSAVASQPVTTVASMPPATDSAVTPSPALSGTGRVDWLAVAVLAWMVGAVGFMLRLAGGWIVARRYVTRAVQPASEQIVLLVHDLAERMNVRGALAVVQSAAVSVPVMVGWLRPTIVLPIAALAGLTPDQIEALIAHELAHVKRHDYLVNLLQSTAEALLFYHPAVWWLSRRVRAERELCCDDVAVSVCDRLVYVRALTDLAALVSPNVAMAATGGDLLGRVRRILGAGESAPASRNAAMPLMAMALVAAIVVPAAIASAPPPQHPMTARHAGVDAGTHDLLHQTPTPTPLPMVSPEMQEVLKKHLEELHRKIAEMQDVEAQKKAELHQQSAKTVDQAKLAHEAELVALQQQLERVKQLQEKGLTSQAQLNDVIAALTKAQAKGDAEATRVIELAAVEQQLARVKELHAKGLASQAQLNEMQAHLTQAQAKGDTLATAAAQLKAAQIELERAKTLVDKGLMTANTLANLEQNVANLQRQVAQAEESRLHANLLVADQRLATDASALREQIAAQQSWVFKQIFYLSNAKAMDVSQILNEMLTGTAQPRPMITANADANTLTVQASESMLGLIKNIIAAVDKPKSEINEQTLKNLQAQIKTNAESQAKLLHQPIEHTIEHLSPTTFVRAGDIVNLTISGEPGLPNTYVVAEDGTIRVPFMGSIKVAGLSATQIRNAIGRIITDKKLGTIDQVTVRAARPSKEPV